MFFRSVGLIASLNVTVLYSQAIAIQPSYAVKNGIHIAGVGPSNPMIYDNDWWKDVPDAAYLWAKASVGDAPLRGNIVSRDMWDWQKGYLYKREDCMKDALALYEDATASGLRNIPSPIEGANEALVRPTSGIVAETRFTRTAGSDLIVAEALRATPEKPLLVFVGGPCTTVANAYLTNPSIANRLIVFQIDGGAYNGKDSWSWEIAKSKLYFVNWANDYFWGEWSSWNIERFNELPKNRIGEMLRTYSVSDLGKANQWGDGAWIFAVFKPSCITKVESDNGIALTVPQDGNVIDGFENEFFETMKNSDVYHGVLSLDADEVRAK